MDDYKNYRVEYSNGMVKCYNTNTYPDSKTPIWEATANFIDFPPVERNKSIGRKLNLDYKVKHYHDLDVTELYVGYQYIKKMIDRISKTYTEHKVRELKWDMGDLRSYCQMWLDNIRFRQDISQRSWMCDKIKYFFKGQLKQRIRWIQTFTIIYGDLVARLDDIDGGVEKNQQDKQTPQQQIIGFANNK